MARQTETTKRRRTGAGLLTKVLILVLLFGMGWQLYRLQNQVKGAQVTREQLSGQVEALQQENDALSADIAEGPTPEKTEELARDQLGMVTPGERVFYDVSN